MTKRDQIINLISETLGVEIEEITPEANFYEDLNADRVEVADILIKAGEKSGVSLDENDLSKIKTVADLLNIIEEDSDEF